MNLLSWYFLKTKRNIITCDKIFLQTKFSIPNESIDMDEFVESSRICQTKSRNDQLSSYHPLLSRVPWFRGGRLQYLTKNIFKVQAKFSTQNKLDLICVMNYLLYLISFNAYYRCYCMSEVVDTCYEGYLSWLCSCTNFINYTSKMVTRPLYNLPYGHWWNHDLHNQDNHVNYSEFTSCQHT